jgi:hypothetical protein
VVVPIRGPVVAATIKSLLVMGGELLRFTCFHRGSRSQ